jgi:hypothetical protein
LIPPDEGEIEMSRQYSIKEIDQMRRSLRDMYPTGVSYKSSERAAEVEDRLRTHMQNGTDPADLEKAAREAMDQEIKAHEHHQELMRQMAKAAPPPRVLKTKDDVIDEWYQTCVAHYEGASVTASDLYGGFGGQTLKSFASRRAPDGIHITQRDMEKFLARKGVRTRGAMFAKRYDGIMHIMYGNVRSGNYGT